jgi:hypothetical protein
MPRPNPNEGDTTMNKKLSLKLAIVSFTIAALALAGLIMEINSAYAAEATAIIGKANIKAGTEFGGITMISKTKGTPFTFTALEDQTLYVIKKLGPKAGMHNGGYILDATGFKHSCPAHGLEVINETARIGLPIEMVDDGTVEIILFEQGMPNAGDTVNN